jgi:sugar/nucleoside kinase (ribokinase family)
VRFDYVTVGHVTVDVLLEGSGDLDAAPHGGGLRRPGGGAFYSALQAARLGLRALIVTRGVADELEPLLAPYARELELRILPAEHTTTLLTRGRGRARRQRQLAWAGPFEESVAVDAKILHLAPVARETPRSWRGHADFVGLTPQGLVRRWNANGDVARAPLARERVPERCDAMVFSAEERERCGELLSRSEDAVVAITAGAQPTTVLQPPRAPLEVAAYAVARPRDDLGAGDVFAAAFFAALHEGLPAARAAALGNAAASLRIAGSGPDAIGDRRAVEQRVSAGGRSAARR